MGSWVTGRLDVDFWKGPWQFHSKPRGSILRCFHWYLF